MRFFDTTLPLLFKHRSAFTSPPLVYFAVPFQTLRYDPVCIFLVTRLGFFTWVRRTALFDAFGARGFVAFAAFGALGFMAARTAFLAAFRVARRAARFMAARTAFLAAFR